MVQLNRSPKMAHRLAYETWVGPIPEGQVVRHKCDNPPCINPEHLETGTHRDNSQDMIKRQRARTKLSGQDVKAIRELSEYYTRAELGRKYGVAACTISQIVRYKARLGDA